MDHELKQRQDDIINGSGEGASIEGASIEGTGDTTPKFCEYV